MSSKCVVSGCRSGYTNSDTNFTFKFPSEENKFNDWVENIEEATGSNLSVSEGDVICINHFEETNICRYSQTYNHNSPHKSNQNSRLCLTKNAVPTIFKINEFQSPRVKKKDKRGSCGYANLQKARMKKLRRKERMRSLMAQRLQQKDKTAKVPSVTSKDKKVKEEYALEKDYFLGNRHISTAEKLIIQLRLPSLLERHHNGENLCKKPPESIKDTKVYPTFDIIQNIIGLFEGKRNPVEWSVLETSRFVRHISSSAIAKAFRAEEIDGEALMNLTKADLIKHFFVETSTAEKLITTFSSLREEVIKRFINV